MWVNYRLVTGPGKDRSMLYRARLNHVIFTRRRTRKSQDDEKVEKARRNRMKRQTGEGPNFTAITGTTWPYARESSKLP